MSTPIDPSEVEALLDQTLEFPTAFGRRGMPPKVPIEARILNTFPLTADHVRIAQDYIDSGRTLGVSQGLVKQLRHSHHRAAQLLASGMKDYQVAALCGLVPGRLSFLKNNDPAFQELLSFYSAEVNEEFTDFVRSAGSLSMDLIDKLRDDLESNPEKFTPTITLEAIRILADRSGNAPVSKSVSVNVNTDLADRLRRARERSANYLDPPLDGTNG